MLEADVNSAVWDLAPRSTLTGFGSVNVELINVDLEELSVKVR